MTAAERRTQAERTHATRTALIAAGRDAFARHGYAEAVAADIVAEAGVTRGALYHHFGGKDGLFEAVFRAIETELVGRVATELDTTDDLWEAVQAGLAVFLRACSEPDVVQIALLDAPTVLGWERWRAIEAEHGMGLLVATLEHARDRQLIVELPTGPLAEALFGALIQAALAVAHAEGVRQQAIQQNETVLLALLDGLRTDPEAAGAPG